MFNSAICQQGTSYKHRQIGFSFPVHFSGVTPLQVKLVTKSRHLGTTVAVIFTGLSRHQSNNITKALKNIRQMTTIKNPPAK